VVTGKYVVVTNVAKRRRMPSSRRDRNVHSSLSTPVRLLDYEHDSGISFLRNVRSCLSVDVA
jgi:hypothetical protein